jgi:putative glutamine amidotransferase
VGDGVRAVEVARGNVGRMYRVAAARDADACPVSVSVLSGLRAAPMPLIAVTTSEMRDNPFDLATPQADPPRREMALGMTYLEAIGRAGALAVVVPPVPGPAIPALLDRVDGIVLSGGPDIHPDAYGAPPHPALGPTEPRLDAFELALARAADERDMPILAICRGAQLFNVARGGTLHQHLPDVVGDGVTHRQNGAPGAPIHGVSVAAGSRLAAILGTRTPRVNSFHHQAIDVLGERLTITARAEDGTVEAFEATDRSFVVGVQWHAECMVDHDEQTALFAALVDACAAPAAGGETSAAAAGSA